MNDHLPLTDRQLEILRTACLGPTMKEAAYQLFMNESSLKNHLTAIYQKLVAAGSIQKVPRPRTLACVWLYQRDQAVARR